MDLKQAWRKNYQTAPEQLNKMASVSGLISAFNANIDAVIKISGKKIESLIETNQIDAEQLIQSGVRKIESAEDALRGLIHCFKGGIAEEWLIRDKKMFTWLQDQIGYDKLQMGGQGGIVANVMAICGVQAVYVHGAAIPKEQAELFLDRENLITNDEEGKLIKAYSTNREDDISLIHWIIEFDRGDKISIGDQIITCPKSNRFIATYDPLNFKLAIDPYFAYEMAKPEVDLEYVILSGYQMLQNVLPDGEPGAERIDLSLRVIDSWKKTHPHALMHLEMASTQDPIMRKYVLDHVAKRVDSLGFNERELIDLLEVIDEIEWVELCNRETSATNLFQGMLKLQSYTNCGRLQLHMFGLYLTLQKKEFSVSPVQNRNGMQLAAVIAAAKAGTGAINEKEVLLWAKDQLVSDQGLQELEALCRSIPELAKQQNFMETGIGQMGDLELIAVPTILIDKPITLVGMGDTISSISLVAAR